ncbi:MAG: hypothetical protein GYB53_10135 [Rhodobacteraceae bacterium]|nr:hypothetical protein [Paracoccaceae bacterium]MBR9820765.1 hypothetical protein [Paracoccaceae bacterium]
MSRTESDYLLYQMSHVVRDGADGPDREFARRMFQAGKDRWFIASRAEIERMRGIETRYWRAREAAQSARAEA